MPEVLNSLLTFLNTVSILIVSIVVNYIHRPIIITICYDIDNFHIISIAVGATSKCLLVLRYMNIGCF